MHRVVIGNICNKNQLQYQLYTIPESHIWSERPHTQGLFSTLSVSRVVRCGCEFQMSSRLDPHWTSLATSFVQTVAISVFSFGRCLTSSVERQLVPLDRPFSTEVAISVTLKMQDRRPMAGAGRPVGRGSGLFERSCLRTGHVTSCDVSKKRGAPLFFATHPPSPTLLANNFSSAAKNPTHRNRGSELPPGNRPNGPNVTMPCPNQITSQTQTHTAHVCELFWNGIVSWVVVVRVRICLGKNMNPMCTSHPFRSGDRNAW